MNLFNDFNNKFIFTNIDYGYLETLLEMITIPVIVIGIILLILGICYIWACRRHKEVMY